MNGKYILLDFWATWCKPCIENIQYLQSLERELDQLGVEIIMVAIDDTHERVRSFVKKNRLHWASILIDKSMSIPVKRYYNAEAIPQSILVSPAGLIVQAGSSLRNPRLLETLRKEIGRR
jgi:thiol-disulfide isomerase/thioredoxin